MATNLVLYSTQPDYYAELMDEVEERLAERALHHYASELLAKAIRDQDELEQALQKAMTALCAAHLPCRQHMKKVFISYGHDIKNDWLLSDLAMRLILMNADTSNPVVARLQVELLSDHPVKH